MVHVRNLDQNQSIFALSERSSDLLDLGDSDQNWSSSKRLCWLLKPVGISRKLQKFPLPLVFVFYKFFLISGVKKFEKNFYAFFQKFFSRFFLPVFCAKKNKKKYPLLRRGDIFFFIFFAGPDWFFIPKNFFAENFFAENFFGIFSLRHIWKFLDRLCEWNLLEIVYAWSWHLGGVVLLPWGGGGGKPAGALRPRRGWYDARICRNLCPKCEYWDAKHLRHNEFCATFLHQSVIGCKLGNYSSQSYLKVLKNIYFEEISFVKTMNRIWLLDQRPFVC